MRRQSLRLRWPVLAFSVALVGLALPTMNAAATDARVVVAGVAPVPANVTVVHQAITTTFDVTLVPRSSTDSQLHSSSRTRRRRLSPLPHDAQFAQRFGASAASVATVRDYFDGFGLSVGALSKVASCCT